MRVLVLGGTGAMGILLIHKALAAGYIVTVYVRSPSKLPEDISSHESVIVVKGELTDEDTLRHSIRNVDAILSNLGPGTTPSHFPGAHPPGTPLAKGYSLILRLMKEPGIACKRIILLGTVSISDPADKRDLAIWTLVQGVKITAYDAYADVVAIGETIRKEGEGIEWTIVRVPLLTKSESEQVIAGHIGEDRMGTSVSRAGFAAFCIHELIHRQWVRKAPMICSDLDQTTTFAWVYNPHFPLPAMMEDVEFEPEAAVATAKAVYKECWGEFYTWYCTGLVNTLDLGASPLVDLQGREELEDRMPSEKESLVLSSEASSRLTYVDDDALDLDDELVQPELQQVKSMNMVLKVKTVPPYTSYQSIRHSVYLRGDLWEDKATGSEVRLAPKVIGDQEDVPNLEELRRDAKRVEKRQIVNIETEENMARNQESMPFIPLDIPVGSAYREEYAQAFHDIEEWQDSDVHWDNNEDIIEGETVRRLMFTHRMNKDTIDRTQVLPRSVQKLCYTLKNRTCLESNDVYPKSSNLPPLPIDDLLQVKANPSLAAQVNETAMLNCYHIDCQAVMCRTHYSARRRAEKQDPGERGRGPQVPRRPEHKLTSRQLFTMFKREKHESCGDQCFMFLESSSIPDSSSDIVVHSDEVEPEEKIVSDMRDIWGMMPDALPCYVAIMGLGSFSCRQAYMTRCQMFPDPEKSDSDSGSEGRARKKKPKAAERKNLPGQANKGRRDAAASSHPKQTYVELPSANATPTGVNAIQTSAGVAQPAGHPCTNVQMMLGMWKPTKVRPSQFGNGLFLGAEQAMKGDLIVEYTGDIIHPRTAFRRTMVSFHTDRNYIFDVDQDGLKYSIDAGAAGNESRFINHPMNGSPNCSARFVYVCGQLRLGIYALQVIYPGQELFIHYGETFFTKEKPKGDPDSDASAVEEGYASGEDDEEDDDDDDDSGDSISL